MRQWILFEALGLILAVGVLGLDTDISIAPAGSGYLLKPLYDGVKPEKIPMVDESMFVVTNPRSNVRVEAFYGPFDEEVVVPSKFLEKNHSNQIVGPVILNDNVDLSAHIVWRTINRNKPIIQVLFHASQIPSRKRNRSAKTMLDQTWCLSSHVVLGKLEITFTCDLLVGAETCLATSMIPDNWWISDRIQTVEVYYSAKEGVCQHDWSISGKNSSGLYSTIHRDSNVSTQRNHAGTVTLSSEELSYQEVKEDQHILIYLPQESYYPGAKFSVPVKLQAESDLEVFVVRVKARSWLKILGATPKNPGDWKTTVDINKNKHSAMVTAFVNKKEAYTKTDSIQEIFEWNFEVEEAPETDGTGRMVFNLEYEMTLSQKETYGSIQNRVVARVHIQRDSITTIIPVIKMTELVNTARLTGSIKSWDMKVFALSSDNPDVSDVTAKATCHSGDASVLKVSESCDQVFFDGKESKASSSVSVIAKYGRHTKFLFFKVWQPELPLLIQLSDVKLSQIKTWRTSTHTRSRSARNSEKNGMVDDMNNPFATACQLRYQQAKIEVYTQFKSDNYLTHPKAWFRITDLVESGMRVTDPSIAAINGNTVQGLRTGRTEVQVRSQNGEMLGATEVKVMSSKVAISRLRVDVVAGMEVKVSNESYLQNTLTAYAQRLTKLKRKYQTAILDLHLDFSDNTTMSMTKVSPADYFLDITSLNDKVVALAPMQSPAQPKIVALSHGKGEYIKISLELGDACAKKKSRPLASAKVYVNVDMEDSDGTAAMGDMEYTKVEMSDVRAKGMPENDIRDMYKSKNNEDNAFIVDPNDIPGFSKSEESFISPNHEAQQQHVRDSKKPSGLEIGMYVLLAIFCLAITVFAANCAVFIYRYRSKKMPRDQKGSTIQNAGDWVWIGRSTLERNSIQTDPITALVPDEDFNGNQSLLGTGDGSQPVTPTCAAPQAAASNGGGSNRNSYISTYKGSECSIRITANPLGEPAPSTSQEGKTPEKALPPLPPPSQVEEEDEDMEIESEYENEGHSEVDIDATNNNGCEAGASAFPTDIQWDYEAMGLNYDQLMEYFDNLKESSA